MPDFFGLQISSGELKPGELEKNEHRTMNKQCIPKPITLKVIHKNHKNGAGINQWVTSDVFELERCLGFVF